MNFDDYMERTPEQAFPNDDLAPMWTDEEPIEAIKMSDYEAEYYFKFKPKIGDCLIVHCSIRNTHLIVQVEGFSTTGLLDIQANYGHSFTSIMGIKKNLGYQGTWEEIIEKYPEYFI